MLDFNIMTSRTRASPSKEADIALSIGDWEAQGKEALELKCTSLHLESTGTPDILAQRLFEYFHSLPDSGDESPGSLTRSKNTKKKGVLNLSDGTSTDDDGNRDDEKERQKFDMERPSPSPSGHDLHDDTGVVKGSERPEDISTQEYDQATAQTALETSEANALLIQDVLERVGELGAGRDLLLDELRALRSQVTRTVAAKPTQPPPKPGPKPTKPSVKRSATSPTRNSGSPARKRTRKAGPKTDDDSLAAKPDGRRKGRSPAAVAKTKRNVADGPAADTNRKRSSGKRGDDASPAAKQRPKHKSARGTGPVHKSKSKSKSVSPTKKRRSRRRSSSSSSSSSTSGMSSSHSPAHRRGSPLPPAGTLAPLSIEPNKFTPAAIPRRCRELIAKGRYVEFEKLRPVSIDIRTRQERNNNVQMKFSESTGTYRLEKTKNEAIQTFPQWMDAWNAFMQTRLHYKPKECHALFSYQKTITRLASQFTFKAVYAYDINFRSGVAAQFELDSRQRTLAWGAQVDAELESVHLTQANRLPPVTCYNCNGKGHVTTYCPEPKQRERPRSKSRSPRRPSGRNNNSSNSNNNSNHNDSSNNRGRSDNGDGGSGNNFRPFPGNCNHYNQGNCSRGRLCRFAHRCNICDGLHTRSECRVPSTTSSGFRPGR